MMVELIQSELLGVFGVQLFWIEILNIKTSNYNFLLLISTQLEICLSKSYFQFLSSELLVNLIEFLEASYPWWWRISTEH